MNVTSLLLEELSRSCDEFDGAQCKAVCLEAGMIALRVQEVQSKKKTSLQYFASFCFR
ncbi:26S proteasome regulatory subunit 6A [Entomophthora muscae]|uniref:26S proteasome regulatory subunit 6A n=1 Tax=Entomophthora muscae TaxID=34485 RepID=A0ACC2SZB5_9FUNG|nr:26S proteasome regulatory subunit 6A [Entomophthora muscae]